MNDDYFLMTENERIELHEFWSSITEEKMGKFIKVRFFHCFYMLIGEIENGGMHQYISNSSGDSFNFLLKHLEQYGFSGIQIQFKLILEILGIDTMPEDRENRNILLDSYSDHQYKLFNEIDEYFKKNADIIEENFFHFYTGELR